MARRRRKRTSSRGGTETAEGAPRIVPWRERARVVIDRLRRFARDQRAEALEAHLRLCFGEPAEAPPDADLQRAFDDYVCTPGSAEEGRSLVRAFAEETDDLSRQEREDLPRWEGERTRRVYLLDRAFRERLELWNPLSAERLTLHLLERMAPAEASGLPRGAVVIATAVPWASRHVALGQLEIYAEDEAIQVYRREVRGSGRRWHDLPAPTPQA